jgi:hypothetical protein
MALLTAVELGPDHGLNRSVPGLPWILSVVSRFSTAFAGLDGIHGLFHGAAMNGLFSICGICREITS